MPWRRTLLIYFSLVVVTYGALMVPWPGVMSGYRRVMAATSNIFLRRIANGRMTFEVMESPTLDKDITVNVQNISTGSKARMSVNARRSYLPVSLAAALIVAAPIPWRRKVIALGLGLVLMMAYVQFTFWLKIVHMLSEPKFGAMQLADSTRKFLMLLIKLTMSPVLPYIVSVVVFGLVTVRREDVVRLSASPRQPRMAK